MYLASISSLSNSFYSNIDALCFMWLFSSHFVIRYEVRIREVETKVKLSKIGLQRCEGDE